MVAAQQSKTQTLRVTQKENVEKKIICLNILKVIHGLDTLLSYKFNVNQLFVSQLNRFNEPWRFLLFYTRDKCSWALRWAEICSNGKFKVNVFHRRIQSFKKKIQARPHTSSIGKEDVDKVQMGVRQKTRNSWMSGERRARNNFVFSR